MERGGALTGVCVLDCKAVCREGRVIGFGMLVMSSFLRDLFCVLREVWV